MLISNAYLIQRFIRMFYTHTVYQIPTFSKNYYGVSDAVCLFKHKRTIIEIITNMTTQDFFEICDFTPGKCKIACVVGVNNMAVFNQAFENAYQPKMGFFRVDCGKFSKSQDLWNFLLESAAQFGLVDPLYSRLLAEKEYVILFENIDVFDSDEPNECLNLLCSLLKDDNMINPAICLTYNLSKQLSPYFRQRLGLSSLGWYIIDGESEEICNREEKDDEE